jgi:hypothetical protein
VPAGVAPWAAAVRVELATASAASAAHAAIRPNCGSRRLMVKLSFGGDEATPSPM